MRANAQKERIIDALDLKPLLWFRVVRLTSIGSVAPKYPEHLNFPRFAAVPEEQAAVAYAEPPLRWGDVLELHHVAAATFSKLHQRLPNPVRQSRIELFHVP